MILNVPLVPNVFLSIITAWKWHKPNKIPRVLVSNSSKSEGVNERKARFKLALIPEGASLVHLIEQSSIPIGTAVEGSEDKNKRNLSITGSDIAFRQNSLCTFFTL